MESTKNLDVFLDYLSFFDLLLRLDVSEEYLLIILSYFNLCLYQKKGSDAHREHKPVSYRFSTAYL